MNTRGHERKNIIVYRADDRISVGHLSCLFLIIVLSGVHSFNIIERKANDGLANFGSDAVIGIVSQKGRSGEPTIFIAS